jgi:hypothetical protein
MVIVLISHLRYGAASSKGKHTKTRESKKRQKKQNKKKSNAPSIRRAPRAAVGGRRIPIHVFIRCREDQKKKDQAKKSDVSAQSIPLICEIPNVRWVSSPDVSSLGCRVLTRIKTISIWQRQNNAQIKKKSPVEVETVWSRDHLESSPRGAESAGMPRPFEIESRHSASKSSPINHAPASQPRQTAAHS